MCSIDDIEITYKDVHEVYTVDEDGQMQDFKETYSNESYPAYYSCDSCGKSWDIYEGHQDEIWEKIKEHFDE